MPLYSYTDSHGDAVEVGELLAADGAVYIKAECAYLPPAQVTALRAALAPFDPTVTGTEPTEAPEDGDEDYTYDRGYADGYAMGVEEGVALVNNARRNGPNW